MTDFTVVCVEADRQSVELVDRRGNHHVARLETQLPAVGTSLISAQPFASARVVIAESSGDVYRVTAIDRLPL